MLLNVWYTKIRSQCMQCRRIYQSKTICQRPVSRTDHLHRVSPRGLHTNFSYRVATLCMVPSRSGADKVTSREATSLRPKRGTSMPQTYMATSSFRPPSVSSSFLPHVPRSVSSQRRLRKMSQKVIADIRRSEIRPISTGVLSSGDGW